MAEATEEVIQLIASELSDETRAEFQRLLEGFMPKSGGVLVGGTLSGGSVGGQLDFEAAHNLSDPADDRKAPVAVSKQGRSYTRINTNGKMEFVIRFPTGDPVIVATEP